MGPAGFSAGGAGWVTTEVGRQPWTVYGLLRTADSVSPLDAPAVAASLLAFVIVYFAVFGAGTWYILRLMAKPPEPHESATLAGPVRTAGITPARSEEHTSELQSLMRSLYAVFRLITKNINSHKTLTKLLYLLCSEL